MSDVALKRLDTLPGRPTRFDLCLDGADLATDAGLQSAVILSLCTDRLAEAEDAIPGGTANRRGWWGDAFAVVEGDRIGSRLWLLGREKDTPAVLERAREYAEEALAWLIEDGVARRTEVTAERTRPGVLGLMIAVERTGGGRWQTTWEGQLNAF